VQDLGPTQHPLQRVSVVLSRGVNLGDNRSPSSAESRIIELYLHFPIYLHSVMLNGLSTVTALPLIILVNWQVNCGSAVGIATSGAAEGSSSSSGRGKNFNFFI
jgi:hypothetical protein